MAMTSEVEKLWTEQLEPYVFRWLEHGGIYGRKLHVIGMLHHRSLTNIEVPVLKSQAETFDLLNRLQPDFMGLEGWWREVFSLNTFLRDRWIIRQIFEPDMTEDSVRTLMLTNISAFSSFYYALCRPSLRVAGIEQEYLYRASVQAMKVCDQLVGDPKIAVQKTLLDWGLWRSLYAVARSIELMIQRNLVVGVLPMGGNHLVDIMKNAHLVSSISLEYHNTSGLSLEQLGY